MNKEELEKRFKNQRSTKFTIVLNDNELNLFKSSKNIYNKLMTAENYSVNFIGVICHDKDTDEQGNLKTKHYHVVISYDKTYRIGSIINLLTDLFHCNENQITIDKCNDLVAQTRYLIHLDDGDKEQYLPFDVYTNDVETFNKYCLVTKVKSISELIAVVKRYHYDLEEIMLNIVNYDKWRRYINDLVINYNRKRC